MKYLNFILITIWYLVSCNSTQSQADLTLPTDGPIQLHPQNHHYFLYKGKTTALITSAEHYGAVLNLDFDFEKYLRTLAADGMNYTRIFTGVYFEIAGKSFGIQNNTLAPAEGRVITPWEQVSGPSDTLKFDLFKWNQRYFDRLIQFMKLAESLDIIVEVTLFSSIYRDIHWDISPQNPENNVNIEDKLARFDAQTMNNGDLFDFQANMVKKLVNELNRFDNFFFEIQNEPWADHPVGVYNIMNKEDIKPKDWTFKATFGDADAFEWHDRLIEVIVEEESRLKNKHLIAQNYSNFRAPIPYVNEQVSIINFHYAWPDAVEWNYHYNKVIGFDESGFAGSGDQVYRRQAWGFMLSGGGLFNNLDYSFFVGNEDGLGKNDAPGGGSKALRKQLKILSEFLHGFELEKLHPNQSAVIATPGLIPYVLSNNNGTYAIYLRAIGTSRTTFELQTGKGTFSVIAVDPVNGEQSDLGTMESIEGIMTLELEFPEGELALKISRI